MATIFYKNYDDFIESYDDHLKEFKTTYPDAAESDFIHEAKQTYTHFIANGNNRIETFIPFFSYKIDSGIDIIDFDEYGEMIELRICLLLQDLNEPENRENFEKYYFDVIPRDKDFFVEVEFHEAIKPFFNTHDGIRFDKDEFKNFGFSINKILEFLKGRENYDPGIYDHLEDRIKINGNTSLIGHIFKQLIDGGYIEPINHNSGKINQSETAKMILRHFNFIEKPPSTEYFKKAIFENEFSGSERIKIPPKKIFNP